MRVCLSVAVIVFIMQNSSIPEYLAHSVRIVDTRYPSKYGSPRTALPGIVSAGWRLPSDDNLGAQGLLMSKVICVQECAESFRLSGMISRCPSVRVEYAFSTTALNLISNDATSRSADEVNVADRIPCLQAVANNVAHLLSLTDATEPC